MSARRLLLLTCAVCWLFVAEAAAQPTCFVTLPVRDCDAPAPEEDFFMGRVVSVTGKDEQGVADRLSGALYGSAVVSVEESFAGDARGVLKLSWPQSCYGSLEKGHTYLFHGRRTAEGFYSRSWSEDLEGLRPEELIQYLNGVRARARGIPEPAVYGRLLNRAYAPIPGIVIVAETDAGQFEARTDAGGRYSFDKLPEGDYKVYPLLPPGLKPPEGGGTAGAKYEAHAQAFSKWLCGMRRDFFAWDSGAVGGFVEDEQGRGLAYVYMSLSLVENSQTLQAVSPLLNGEAGRFNFTDLPAGSYKIEVAVADEDGGVMHFFYPGVLDRENASTVDLAPGEQLTDLRIRLPRLKRRRIFGEVKMPDGSPVEARVILTDRDERQYQLAMDSKGGWFEFLVLQGRPFRLFAYRDGEQGGRPVRFYKFTEELTAEGDLGPLTITLDEAVKRNPPKPR